MNIQTDKLIVMPLAEINQPELISRIFFYVPRGDRIYEVAAR